MNKRIAILAGILIVSLVMLACSLPVFEAQLQQKDIQSISDSVLQTLIAQNQQYQPRPLNNAEVIASAVAQTVVALNAQNQAAQAAAAVPTLIPYVYVAPMVIPYVYYVAPTATPYPCNAATGIDVTVLDYTNFSLNQLFNKTWRLRNVGICTWNTGYRLAFYSGNSLNGPAYVYLPHSVAPGGTVDVTVPMQAPATAGTYTSYWGLYTDANIFFGRVWVTITAGSIPASFAVSGVSYAIDHVSQAITCGANATFNIQANITTNGAGTVSYHWEISGGSYTATQTLTYGAASTQTVLLSQTITGVVTPGGSYWVKIYIDNPNHQLFAPMAFNITCT
jgi:hypothetical protein